MHASLVNQTTPSAALDVDHQHAGSFDTIFQTHACFPMESRFLPLFFLLLTRIPSFVVATDNDGPGNNGDHGQDPEESSSLRPENECKIPPYSDPGRIQESAIVDKERLLFQGRCFLACASHLDDSKVKRINDISVYWPIMKVKRSCKVERMVSRSSMQHANEVLANYLCHISGES